MNELRSNGHAWQRHFDISDASESRGISVEVVQRNTTNEVETRPDLALVR